MLRNGSEHWRAEKNTEPLRHCTSAIRLLQKLGVFLPPIIRYMRPNFYNFWLYHVSDPGDEGGGEINVEYAPSATFSVGQTLV